MSQQLILKPKATRHRHPRRKVAHAFVQGGSGAAAATADSPFPMVFRDPEEGKNQFVTGSISAAIHLGAIGLLVVFSYLAPEIENDILEVVLLRDEPKREEPRPAPKALAERMSPNFAPALQAVQPQIVNPRVVANAAPAVNAEVLQMDAVSSATAPTQINRATTVVERVSAVSSIAAARASNVDVSRVTGPVVRGPTRVNAPVGPSVGPRKVTAAPGAQTIGTGSLAISGGSSVREGVLSSRDVQGSPTGAVLVAVDTAVGEGNLSGPGGTGTGLLPGGDGAPDCLQAYMAEIQDRTLARWSLPPGVADQQVTLRFAVDVAGSATSVQLIKATDNSLGASAIDAMRAASPFPPMPDRARCLAQRTIRATFSSESVAG